MPFPAAVSAAAVEGWVGKGPTWRTGPPLVPFPAAVSAAAVEGWVGKGPTWRTGPPLVPFPAAVSAAAVEGWVGKGPMWRTGPPLVPFPAGVSAAAVEGWVGKGLSWRLPLEPFLPVVSVAAAPGVEGRIDSSFTRRRFMPHSIACQSGSVFFDKALLLILYHAAALRGLERGVKYRT